MTRKKRQFTTFNLSFLDIMACGFGAVILVFLIINHSVKTEVREVNRDLLSESRLLAEDVREGEAGLVRLRNTLSEIDLQIVEASGLASRISEDKDRYEALLADLRRDGFTDSEAIEALKAEILSLEEQVKALREKAREDSGTNARSFIGEGDRQYLTGLNLGGRHIAILLDISASMLADKLVQVIRLRNMDQNVQRRAEKWTRSLKTVDWLTAQLPVNSKYQVITFNTQAKPALAGSAGKWLEVADRAGLEKLTTTLRNITPGGGTSLINAFIALQSLSPVPDNIFIITDGLPTQGKTAPAGTKVSGNARRTLYRQAVKQLPRNVPVNIILEPMEGDPMAAPEFWQLAQISHGSLLSPSRDWP